MLCDDSATEVVAESTQALTRFVLCRLGHRVRSLSEQCAVGDAGPAGGWAALSSKALLL
jgi:hypothetical protein